VCVIMWPGSNKVQHGGGSRGGTATIKEMIVDKNEARKFNSLTQQRIKTEAPAAQKIRLAASPPQDDVFTFCSKSNLRPNPREEQKRKRCIVFAFWCPAIKFTARDYNTRPLDDELLVNQLRPRPRRACVHAFVRVRPSRDKTSRSLGPFRPHASLSLSRGLPPEMFAPQKEQRPLV
jgi:hypothetical protein